MSIADVIDHSFELSSDDQFAIDDSLRLRMMLFLQNQMDFEKLAGILIKRKSNDLLFEFLDKKELRKKNRSKAIFCAFK